MLKKIVLILFLCVLPFGAAGNAKNLSAAELTDTAEAAPDNGYESITTLKSYLAAIYGGDLQKAYELLCGSDKKIISREQFFRQKQLFSDPTFKEFHANAHIEITLTKIEDNKAEAYAVQDLLNLSEISLATQEITQKNPDALNSKETIQQALKEYFNGNYPSVPTKIFYILIKENNVWKVSEPELAMLAKILNEM